MTSLEQENRILAEVELSLRLLDRGQYGSVWKLRDRDTCREASGRSPGREFASIAQAAVQITRVLVRNCDGIEEFDADKRISSRFETYRVLTRLAYVVHRIVPNRYFA